MKLDLTVLGLGLIAASLASAGSPITARYPEIQAELRALVREHPENVRLFQIGVSDSGEVIEGVSLGSGEIHNLVVATHHGNEYGSTAVGVAFARAVAASPIVGQTLHVIPVLNIEGYNARRRGERAGGNLFDPNRDYPGLAAPKAPTSCARRRRSRSSSTIVRS